MSSAPRIPEKVHQQHIVQLLRAVGARVYVMGTRRPRGDHPGTCQTPGIPDLMAILPRRVGLLFVEVKSATGRLRPEQAAFRDQVVDLTAAGARVYHTTGTLDAVIATLIGLRLLTPDQVPDYRRPAPEDATG